MGKLGSYNLSVYPFSALVETFYMFAMDGITQILNDIKNNYNLSGARFADKVGKVKNTFANYLNGSRPIPTDVIVDILNTFPDLSADWLLRGKGDMFNKVNPDVERMKKEIYDLTMPLLVKEGVITELKDNILSVMKQRYFEKFKKEV